MAKLSRNRRRRLSRRQFASPKGHAPNRKANQYPIHDRRHAANAKARATQMYNAGKLSRSKMQQIHARANKVLRRRKGR